MAVAAEVVANNEVLPKPARKRPARKQQAVVKSPVRLKKESKLQGVLKKCRAAIASSTGSDENPTVGGMRINASVQPHKDVRSVARAKLSRLHHQLKLLELPEYSQAVDVASVREQFVPVIDWLLHEGRDVKDEPAYWMCIRMLLRFDHTTIYSQLTEILILLSISYSNSDNGKEELELCCELVQTFNKLHQSNRLLKRMLDAFPALHVRSDQRYLFLAQPLLEAFFMDGYAGAPVSAQNKLLRILIDEIYAVYKPQLQNGDSDPSFFVRFKVLAYWIWCSLAFLSAFQVSIPAVHLRAVQDMLGELKTIVEFLSDAAVGNADGLTVFLVLLHAWQSAANCMKIRTQAGDSQETEFSSTSIDLSKLTEISESCDSQKPEQLFWCLENTTCLIRDEAKVRSIEGDNSLPAEAVLKIIFKCRFAFLRDDFAPQIPVANNAINTTKTIRSTESVFAVLFLCRGNNIPPGNEAETLADDDKPGSIVELECKKIVRKSCARLIEHYLHATSLSNSNSTIGAETDFANLLFDKRNVKAWCSIDDPAHERDYTPVCELLIAVLPLFNTLPRSIAKILQRYVIPSVENGKDHQQNLINGDALGDSQTSAGGKSHADIMPFLYLRLSRCLVNLSPGQSANSASTADIWHPSLYALQFLCFALANKTFRQHLFSKLAFSDADNDETVSLQVACAIIVRAVQNDGASDSAYELLTTIQHLIEQMKNELFLLESSVDAAEIDVVLNMLQAYDGCSHVLFRCRLQASSGTNKNRTAVAKRDDDAVEVDENIPSLNVTLDFDSVDKITDLIKNIKAHAGRTKLLAKRDANLAQLYHETQKFYDAVHSLDLSLALSRLTRMPDRATFLKNCLLNLPQLCRLLQTLQSDFTLFIGDAGKNVPSIAAVTTKHLQTCAIVLLHIVIMLTKLMLNVLEQPNRSKTADSDESSSVDMPEMVQQCCRATVEVCRFLARFFTLDPGPIALKIMPSIDSDTTVELKLDVSPVLLDYFSRQRPVHAFGKMDRRRLLLTRLLDEQHSSIDECETRLTRQLSAATHVSAEPLLLPITVFPVLAANLAPRLAALVNAVVHLSPHVLGERNLNFYHSVMEKAFVSCVFPLSPNGEDEERLEVALQFIHAAIPAEIPVSSTSGSGSGNTLPLDTMALFIRLHAKLITLETNLANNTTKINRERSLRLLTRISHVMHKLLQCRPRILSQESILQTVDHVGLISNFLNRIYVSERDVTTSSPQIGMEFYEAFTTQIDCLNALLVNNTSFALKCPTPLMKSLALLMMLVLDISCVYKDKHFASGRVSVFLGCAQRLQRVIRLLAQHSDEFKRIGVHLIADYLLRISHLGSVERLPLDAATLKIPPAAICSAIRIGLCQLFRIADKRALQNMKLMLPAHLHVQFQSLYDEYTALSKFDGRAQ